MAAYKSTFTDAIWNRACHGGGPMPKAGDSALAALLLFHGAAMNGGFAQAVESLQEEQLTAAQTGYRYYDLPQIAEIRELFRAQASVDDASLDRRYWEVVPDDMALETRLVAHHTRHPDAYSPF